MPAPTDQGRPARAPARGRLVVAVLLVVAAGWLGFRAVRACDQDRNAAAAAAVAEAPDAVGRPLAPVPGSAAAAGAGGELRYRPGTRLTVVDLRGLAPVAGDERYLVFVRSWAGWTLAGAVSPRPDGTARVSSAAEPKPTSLFEVVVTRAVDDATSVPHGRPVLQWYDASLASPRARKFEFAAGA